MNDPYELIAAYLVGELDDAGAAALKEWLASDPENVNVFVREVHAHSAVRQHLIAESAIEETDLDVGAAVALGSCRRRRTPASRRGAYALVAGAVLAAAAAVLAVVWAVSPADAPERQSLPGLPQTAGRRDAHERDSDSPTAVRTAPVAAADAPSPNGPSDVAPRARTNAAGAATHTAQATPAPDAATPNTHTVEMAVSPRRDDVPAAAHHVAYVDAVQGNIEWSPDDAATWRAAPAGMGLPAGGRIRTKVSHARIVFESGSVVNVDGFTTLTVTSAEGPPKIALVGGQVLVEVARADAGFTVSTPHGQAVDHGTAFGVAVKQTGTTVTVLRGKVEASTDAGSATLTAEREVMLYRRSSVPGFVVPAANLRARYAWVIRPRETATVSFQDGVAPTPLYAGTTDTYLSEEEPDSSFGSTNRILADGRSPEGDDYAVLIRWDVTRIPAGSRVISATITLDAVDPCREESYPVYALLRPWSERAATWRASDDASRWQSPGAKGPRDRSRVELGRAGPSDVGMHTFGLSPAGVTAVQSWVNDPRTNRGILIGSETNTDGIDFSSREVKRSGRRPRLTIRYRPPYQAADEPGGVDQ